MTRNAPQGWSSEARRTLSEYSGMALALALLIAFFSVRTSHFFSITTFQTIANQIPAAIIIAVGMTLVLIIGGIDLSVGSVLALGGAVLGYCLVDLRLPLPVALAACLLTGLVCGLLNGLMVVRWSLPSFIVTLGMLEIARGGAYLVTNSRTKYIGASVEPIAEASVLGLSLPFFVALATVVLGQILLSRTVLGRYIFAVGNNEEVVRLCGIDPRVIKVKVFALCSLLAAVAAIINVSRLASADPNAGSGFELQAIAAVVIGGTSLMGGRGSVVGSFFGVLIIAILGSGLAQIGVQEPTKRLVTGLVIVIAVILDYYRSRLKVRRRSTDNAETGVSS